MKRLKDDELVQVVDLSQDSPDWLPWRNRGIGSSDVALLMSPEPIFDRTVGTLWKQRVGYERAVELDNEHIKRGKDLEPKIRDYVNDYLGLNFEPVCVLRKDAEYLRASLDGVDWENDCLLEIKAPSPKVYQKYRDTWWTPDNYYLQMQYQMLCSNVHYGWFAFGQEIPVDPPFDITGSEERFIELEVKMLMVKANHSLQLEIEKRCALFQKAVETRTPIGWSKGELVLYDTNPTIFVVIGNQDQLGKLFSIRTFPIPMVANDYAQSNNSFIVGFENPQLITRLKSLHPNHHIKIINLIENPLSNKVDNIKLTRAGLLKHIKSLI